METKPLDAELDRRLRAELASLAPLLAMAKDEGQQHLLDHAFLLIDCDPPWEVWLYYARLYLTSYRARNDGRG